MKNLMQFTMVLAGIMFVSHAVAANKVVVIPLNSSGPPAKLWGEGREGVSATHNITANGIIISRSNGLASWDGAAAACPANTWVCSKEEVQHLRTTFPTSNMMYISCENNTGQTRDTWVKDSYSGSLGSTVYVEYNFSAGTNVVKRSKQRKCAYYPVWCCSIAQ